jgi:hypothetical protein
MSVSGSVSEYLLPDGIISLLHAFSDTTSDSSMASSWEDSSLILTRVLGIFSGWVYWIYYLEFDNYCGARIVVLPPLGEVLVPSLTTFAAANNHNKPSGYYTYKW